MRGVPTNSRQACSLASELRREGFCLRRGFERGVSTLDLARAIGTIVDLGEVLPGAGIPTVQTLRPRSAVDGSPREYSGHYGLGAFPLHTDLAHWAAPPHYFLLRCVVGCSDVPTRIAAWSPILDFLGESLLRRAVFAARRHRVGSSGLVRAMSGDGSSLILRWDPIFIKPLNRDARLLVSAMSVVGSYQQVLDVPLEQPGDTLVVDNWRMLHGRANVDPRWIARRIERVYLSEVL